MDTGIGARVRAARERAGLTLRELAERLDIDHSALARKERGETRIRSDECAAIAKVLGVEPDSLTGQQSGSSTLSAHRLPGIPVINRAPAGPSMSYDTQHYDEYRTAWHFIDRGDINDDTAFAVEVVESSMEPTLKHGDVLVLLPVTEDRTRDTLLKRGAIVFVRFSEDTRTPGVTIARWQPAENGSIMLAKDNPASSPFMVKREAIVRLAVAVEVRRKLS